MKRNQFLGGYRLLAGAKGKSWVKVLVPAFLAAFLLFTGCPQSGDEAVLPEVKVQTKVYDSTDKNIVTWGAVTGATQYTVTYVDIASKDPDAERKSATTDQTYWVHTGAAKDVTYKYVVSVSKRWGSGYSNGYIGEATGKNTFVKSNTEWVAVPSNVPALISVKDKDSDTAFDVEKYLENIKITVKGLEVGYTYTFELGAKNNTEWADNYWTLNGNRYRTISRTEITPSPADDAPGYTNTDVKTKEWTAIEGITISKQDWALFGNTNGSLDIVLKVTYKSEKGDIVASENGKQVILPGINSGKKKTANVSS